MSPMCKDVLGLNVFKHFYQKYPLPSLSSSTNLIVLLTWKCQCILKQNIFSWDWKSVYNVSFKEIYCAISIPDLMCSFDIFWKSDYLLVHREHLSVWCGANCLSYCVSESLEAVQKMLLLLLLRMFRFVVIHVVWRFVIYGEKQHCPRLFTHLMVYV